MRSRGRRRGDELLQQLEEELDVPHREPPPERVAALRATAEARRGAALSTAGTTRPFSRRGLLASGVGVAAGAAAGIVTYEALDDDLPTVPTEAILLLGVPDGVTASAELINHTWGVELLLTIGGLEAGRRYDVRYRARGDRELLAGSFVGVETEQLCRMTGALLREDTEAIELLDEDGEIVLSAQL